MDVRRSVAEPELDAQINIIGTLKLLENCVRYDVEKAVFASTGRAVYGEQQAFPATEEYPQYPLSPYGVAKVAGERYLHFYHVQHSLPHVALRYADDYGPRQDPHGEAGVVAIFCGNLAAGKKSTRNGTGEQTRNYVYVGDAARDVRTRSRTVRATRRVQRRHRGRDERGAVLRDTPGYNWP
jgi:UDP-glucose 4-epimerase